MTKRVLTANATAHLLVDAVCAAVIVGSSTPELPAIFFLYNTFAFSTQCVVGLLTDRLGHCKTLAPVACLWVALCAVLPLQPIVGATLIGLGNSLFHVSAGSEVLGHSEGKAAPLGFFVAPGALGVFAGKTFPELRPVLCGLLILSGIWLLIEKHIDREQTVSSYDYNKIGQSKELLPTALLLLLAVMTRAIGGAVAGGAGQPALWRSLIIVICVFAGKSLGGLSSDRFGIRRVTVISIPLAAFLILIAGRCFAAGAAGQFLLNLSMPVTLFLIYRCLPKSPGFAFGLAASVLWPGTLIGKYVSVSGEIKVVFILLCFGVALFSILFAERKITHEKNS
jgi:FSR family fosmidomycin resistance protein-like MFS transporter